MMGGMEGNVTTAMLIEAGLAAGLDAVGTCAAEPYAGTEQDIADRAERGLFADLRFTMARPESSCHPERLVEDARSVVSAALCYWFPDPSPGDAVGAVPTGKVARFSRFDPYAALHARLGVLASLLEESGHAARVLVDDNHHVDREAAVRSGIGFYGRNTNVITRRHGSWVVLGTIVTSAPLEPTEPMRPGCGSCTLCIDACPTAAIVEPGVLDAGRCLTYWTQSRHEVPEEMAEALGEMVYGCDICQDVCPWNRGIEKRRSGHDPMDGRVDLLDWLAAPDGDLDDRYARFFVPRRKMAFLRRNALIALGNGGDEVDAPIAAAYLDDPEPSVAAAARRAMSLLGGPVAEALK